MNEEPELITDKGLHITPAARRFTIPGPWTISRGIRITTQTSCEQSRLTTL